MGVRSLSEKNSLISLEAFDQLNDVMDSYYPDMGMVLSNTEDNQLYMHIPFKPEN